MDAIYSNWLIPLKANDQITDFNAASGLHIFHSEGDINVRYSGILFWFYNLIIVASFCFIYHVSFCFSILFTVVLFSLFQGLINIQSNHYSFSTWQDFQAISRTGSKVGTSSDDWRWSSNSGLAFWKIWKNARVKGDFSQLIN